MSHLFLSHITPGILLLSKKQDQVSAGRQAVLTEGAWPSNLKSHCIFCAQFHLVSWPRGGAEKPDALQTQTSDLVWSQALGEILEYGSLQ